jgi:hypothetical protein
MRCPLAIKIQMKYWEVLADKLSAAGWAWALSKRGHKACTDRLQCYVDAIIVIMEAQH